MRAHAIVAISMLSACTCAQEDPPAVKPIEAHRVELVAAAAQPLSAAYCAAACAAAGTQSCEKLAATCQYDTNGLNYVEVGGYMLHCKPACAAACLGRTTGRTVCVRSCLRGSGAQGAQQHDSGGGIGEPDASGL